jgi:viroplasmin and RNaseH domain-containing protein
MAEFLYRGDVHPRVTNCKAVFKSFHTLDEARTFMKSKGVSTHKEVIKQTALNTAPRRCSNVYYGVANGADPGVRKVW